MRSEVQSEPRHVEMVPQGKKKLSTHELAQMILDKPNMRVVHVDLIAVPFPKPAEPLAPIKL